MNNNEHATSERRTYPLHQIYFYLTEGCNLRCRHCWLAPKHSTGGDTHITLDADLFRYIVSQAKPLGMTHVKLTGGEPLIHSHITRLLECVRNEDLSLGLETNAVSCTREMAREIKACGRPFVAVSLDGVDPHTHDWMRRTEGAFTRAVAGIGNLVEEGIRPQIIMSVVRRNRDQMEPMVRLAESLGAESVKFNLVQPTARGERMHHSGETLSIVELVRLGQWVETELAGTSRINVFYHHPTAFRPLSRMFGPNGDGCRNCSIFNILGVLPDGSYALCGIGRSVADLVFGDASKDGLAEVWDYSPVLGELRSGLPERLEGICSDCLMKSICLGSCIAQNYYRTGSLWAPFWFCEEAHKHGVFPRTRTITHENAAGRRSSPAP